jgi:hypothetical protein
MGLAAAFLLGNLRDVRRAGLGLAIVVGSAATLVYNIPGHTVDQLIFIPVDFAVAWVAGLAVRARAERAEVAESRARQAEHAVFEDTGKNEPVRTASTETGQGLFLSNFTLVRLGTAQKAFSDPAKRELLARKEELEQKIDTLKYQKAAISQDDYKQQLTDALLELARVQEELDK